MLARLQQMDKTLQLARCVSADATNRRHRMTQISAAITDRVFDALRGLDLERIYMAGLFSNMVSIEDEVAHCRRREIEERRAAEQSDDTSAREAHLDLAGRYAARASQLAERISRLAIGNGIWGNSALSG